MKKNSASMPILIIGAVIIFFSFAAFFITSSFYSFMQVLAFIFLLLSEIAAVVSFLWVTNIDSRQYSKIIIWSGFSVVLSGYLIATTVLFFTAKLWLFFLPIFLLIQLAILCGVAILLVCIVYFSKRTALRNEQDFYNQTTKANEQAKRGGF